MSAPEPVAGERSDLLQSLARQRHFLRHTTRGLTDEQAAQQTTASELSLGGLIKHVALTSPRMSAMNSKTESDGFAAEERAAMKARAACTRRAWYWALVTRMPTASASRRRQRVASSVKFSML